MFGKKCYDSFMGFGVCLQSYLLLAMRLFWGTSFVLMGYGKIMNPDPVIEMFTSLGIPYPEFNVMFVGWVECIGGLMLLFGLLSRLAVIPLSIILIVALFTAHIDATLGIFQDPQRFINQMPFNYLLTCLFVFSFGPGKFSIDGLCGKAFCKPCDK